MSSTSRAWAVAATVAVVEAMKEQGIFRWNYPMRCAYQSAKSRARSLSQQAKMLPGQASSPSSSSSMGSSNVREEERMRQSEESLRKVMYLSCWGAN